MINISEVEEIHYWCHSCFDGFEEKDNDDVKVELFHVSIEKDEMDYGNFRLCKNCLKELQSKISSVL